MELNGSSIVISRETYVKGVEKRSSSSNREKPTEKSMKSRSEQKINKNYMISQNYSSKNLAPVPEKIKPKTPTKKIQSQMSLRTIVKIKNIKNPELAKIVMADEKLKHDPFESRYKILSSKETMSQRQQARHKFELRRKLMSKLLYLYRYLRVDTNLGYNF